MPAAGPETAQILWPVVSDVFVHILIGVFYKGYAAGRVTLCQPSSPPEVQHIVRLLLLLTLSHQERRALSLTLIWNSSSWDLGAIQLCLLTFSTQTETQNYRPVSRSARQKSRQQYHEWEGACSERRSQVGGEGGGGRE